MAPWKDIRWWLAARIYLSTFETARVLAVVGLSVGYQSWVSARQWYHLITLITLQIDEEASEQGKPGYINFKHVVWHEAFIKLFINLDKYSKTGYSYMCYDKKLRWLFPVILILSADYEEQWVRRYWYLLDSHSLQSSIGAWCLLFAVHSASAHALYASYHAKNFPIWPRLTPSGPQKTRRLRSMFTDRANLKARRFWKR